MGQVQKFVSNARKPDGLLGRLMVMGMNAGHAALAEWECGFFGEEAPNHVVIIGAWNGVRDFKTAYLQSLLFPEVMNASSAGIRGFALARHAVSPGLCPGRHDGYGARAHHHDCRGRPML